ncbi:hypothetical protein ACFLZS_01060 [Patescibacteria group bacterium]
MPTKVRQVTIVDPDGNPIGYECRIPTGRQRNRDKGYRRRPREKGGRRSSKSNYEVVEVVYNSLPEDDID